MILVHLCDFREVVLRNQLSSKPRSISLCSLGISLAIGHEDAVRIYNVVNDTLVETKSFKEASDSRVQNLLWRHDNSLLSSDDEGTIYEWDIPRKKATWKLSLPKVKHVAFASLSKDISDYLYVASSDNKIRRIKDGKVTADHSLNNVKVTTLLVTDDLLLAGSDTGKIVGFLLTLRATTFEVRFHVGSICHVASFCDGTSVIAIDSYGIVSTWNFQNKTYGGTLPSRKEVLIDVDKKKKLMQNINEMEEKLRQCTQKADEGKALQNTRFQGEEMKVWGEYREIQCSLRSTIHKLEDEIRVLKSEFEKKRLNNMSTIKKEEEKNEKYFKKKLAEEEVCLQQAKEERERLLQEFERSLAQLKSEKEDVVKEFNTKYCRHQDKFQELEDILDRERAVLEMTKNEREDYIRQATDTRLRSGFDAVCDLRNEMVKEKYMPELDGINSEFNYEKERNRSIEEDFRKKHDTFRRLDEIAKDLKIRLDQKLGDIFRMEAVLDTKTDYSNKLQLEALELTVEGDHKIKECQLELENKENELAEVKQKLQKV
ncbi:uncharacterized protein TNCT_323811 [Trichonephila clavata]|uniref:Uncharacterized protein n=1 Tax=Trichonephila clavata TaxID=2740835 RepID=A0A8X6L5P7_TRICU|nr:uncharacterized protein TNCT_323811 [Trichonephila clavata]